jgi:hypothetical protein
MQILRSEKILRFEKQMTIAHIHIFMYINNDICVEKDSLQSQNVFISVDQGSPRTALMAPTAHAPARTAAVTPTMSAPLAVNTKMPALLTVTPKVPAHLTVIQ